MQSVIDSLLKFSEVNDLWQRTMKSAKICVNNWMQESPDEYKRLFPGLTLSNFLFEDGSQHLIFFENEKAKFTLRTKYSLFTDKQRNKNIPAGFYALDVNEQGEIIDDWLHFN